MSEEIHHRFIQRWATNCRHWKATLGSEEVLLRVKDLPLDIRAMIALAIRNGESNGHRV